MAKDKNEHANLIEQARPLLSPYLDNEVTAAERGLVELALARSPELQTELEGLRQTVVLVADLPRMPAPRPFTLSEADLGLSERPQRAAGLWGWLKPALGGLAVLAVVVLVGAYLFSASPGQQEAAESVALAPAAAQLEANDQATGTEAQAGETRVEVAQAEEPAEAVADTEEVEAAEEQEVVVEQELVTEEAAEVETGASQADSVTADGAEPDVASASVAEEESAAAVQPALDDDAGPPLPPPPQEEALRATQPSPLPLQNDTRSVSDVLEMAETAPTLPAATSTVAVAFSAVATASPTPMPTATAVPLATPTVIAQPPDETQPPAPKLDLSAADTPVQETVTSPQSAASEEPVAPPEPVDVVTGQARPQSPLIPGLMILGVVLVVGALIWLFRRRQ